MRSRRQSNQPVHGTVKLILRSVLDAEFLAAGLGDRFGSQTTGGGCLRVEIQVPGEEHGGGQRSLAGSRSFWRPKPRAEDSESLGKGGEHDTAREQDTEFIDQLVGPLGEVGEATFLDLAVVAEGFVREGGGRGFSGCVRVRRTWV